MSAPAIIRNPGGSWGLAMPWCTTDADDNLCWSWQGLREPRGDRVVWAVRATREEARLAARQRRREQDALLAGEVSS